MCVSSLLFLPVATYLRAKRKTNYLRSCNLCHVINTYILQLLQLLFSFVYSIRCWDKRHRQQHVCDVHGGAVGLRTLVLAIAATAVVFALAVIILGIKPGCCPQPHSYQAVSAFTLSSLRPAFDESGPDLIYPVSVYLMLEISAPPGTTACSVCCSH